MWWCINVAFIGNKCLPEQYILNTSLLKHTQKRRPILMLVLFWRFITLANVSGELPTKETSSLKKVIEA
jgi:hypothetical protein